MTFKNKKLLIIIISVFVGAAVLGVATSLLLLKPWADKKSEKEEQVEARETEEAHEESGTYEQVDSKESDENSEKSEDANKEAEAASSDAEDTWAGSEDINS